LPIGRSRNRPQSSIIPDHRIKSWPTEHRWYSPPISLCYWMECSWNEERKQSETFRALRRVSNPHASPKRELSFTENLSMDPVRGMEELINLAFPPDRTAICLRFWENDGFDSTDSRKSWQVCDRKRSLVVLFFSEPMVFCLISPSQEEDRGSRAPDANVNSQYLSTNLRDVLNCISTFPCPQSWLTCVSLFSRFVLLN
jgi:hypothetical protein